MKNSKTILMMIILAMMPAFLGGCIAVEMKEYRFRMNDDGAGEGSIRFINIVSEEEDEQDVSIKDFRELVSNYIEGKAFEEDNPHYNVIDKRLYEENGVLVGEVVFTFDSMDSIGFYRDRDCKCSKYIYYMEPLSEVYYESNGNYLGENRDLPLLAWSPSEEELYFKTLISENIEGAHSLLPLYESWKEQK